MSLAHFHSQVILGMAEKLELRLTFFGCWLWILVNSPSRLDLYEHDM